MLKPSKSIQTFDFLLLLLPLSWLLFLNKVLRNDVQNEPDPAHDGKGQERIGTTNGLEHDTAH